MNFTDYIAKGDPTIGADPEVFLVTPTNVIVPACGLIGGCKEEPIPVNLGAVQEDNVLAEFNIDPANSVDEFISNINSVYATLGEMAGVHGFALLPQASHNFKKSILKLHPEAMVFGCEPDFNAYTLEENPTPNVESTLRTGAGHIHVGFEHETSDSFSMAGQLIKYLDFTTGLWTVLVDEDTARRERYGKAGAFRPKEYGAEYRVPSNFWLKSNELKEEVYNRVIAGFTMFKNKDELPDEDEVVNAINTHDKDACLQLMGAY